MEKFFFFFNNQLQNTLYDNFVAQHSSSDEGRTLDCLLLVSLHLESYFSL